MFLRADPGLCPRPTAFPKPLQATSAVADPLPRPRAAKSRRKTVELMSFPEATPAGVHFSFSIQVRAVIATGSHRSAGISRSHLRGGAGTASTVGGSHSAGKTASDAHYGDRSENRRSDQAARSADVEHQSEFGCRRPLWRFAHLVSTASQEIERASSSVILRLTGKDCSTAIFRLSASVERCDARGRDSNPVVLPLSLVSIPAWS